MEKLNFVKEGVTKLPPGFRFQPTDEEIVFQYLARKIACCPLPASIIPEVNVCQYDPWDLPGESEPDRYFFSMKEAKHRNGNRTNRTTRAGYWKASGVDKKIICSRKKHEIMGMKKTLVFYKGKASQGCRTNWVMHEYRLVHSGHAASTSQQIKNSTQKSMIEMGDWVLCHIFLKNGSMNGEDETVKAFEDETGNRIEAAQPRIYDFLTTKMTDFGHTISSSSFSSSSSSFSDFSVITEVSSSALYDGESSSS